MGQILPFLIDLGRHPFNTVALPCKCMTTVYLWQHFYYGRSMH